MDINKEKIKVSQKINNKFGSSIRPEDIIFDLKSKSLYVIVDGHRVGCYYDDDLKTVIMYGNLDISQYFIDSLIELLGIK